jgi:hypothetical protein
VIDSIERFGALIDWAMIILNPLEPWVSCAWMRPPPTT